MNEYYLVSIAMEKFGGSFVKHLGRLILLADTDNLKKIKETWPDYWEKYRLLAIERKLGEGI